MLLRDPTCREVIEAGSDAAHASSRGRARHNESLRRLELAEVIEMRKGGRWMLQASELTEILSIARELPGGHDTFDALAHPVGWSLVARLTSGTRERAELAVCGEPPRVCEQLDLLRRIGALEEHGRELTLRERLAHRELLDRLDRVAGNLHMLAFERARRSLFDPAARAGEGLLYASAPTAARSSENTAASNAFNYSRAAFQRSRPRG